jgi:hypothetical protein
MADGIQTTNTKHEICGYQVITDTLEFDPWHSNQEAVTVNQYS